MPETSKDAKQGGESSGSSPGVERRTRIEITAKNLLPGEPVKGMVGQSARMLKLAADINRVARFEYDVLITGANGTGKTAAAQAIHDASSRASRELVKVNAAALPRELIEKLLFGHERGAFSGAQEQQIGYFEAADGGTLFLDEIGELALDLQSKLLAVLDDKKFMRLGGTKPIQCDVRILAATKLDLEGMVAEGRFREDLYFRLKILRVRVPSLDERRDDIPALAGHALAEHARRVGHPSGFTITDEAMEILLERAWPGNIRELKHALIEIASHLEDDCGEITAADVNAVLGKNLLEFGERDGDVRTIIVPPYLVGEELDHYFDRTLITISNTLLEQTKSPKRVAEILKAPDAHTLNQRLKRAELRLEAAAANSTLFVKRLRLDNKSKTA